MIEKSDVKCYDNLVYKKRLCTPERMCMREWYKLFLRQWEIKKSKKRLPLKGRLLLDCALEQVFFGVSPAESSPTFVRSVLYTPEVLKSNTKVLFCHGGVLVLPVLPYHYRFARITASELVCIVLMPDYHLAPEYRMIRVTSALTVTNILFQTAVMWLLPVTAQEAVSPP